MLPFRNDNDISRLRSKLPYMCSVGDIALNASLRKGKHLLAASCQFNLQVVPFDVHFITLTMRLSA